MNRSGEFIGQDSINPALALNPRQPVKNSGNDFDAKMAFPLRPRARMSGMFSRFIDDGQFLGIERCSQLFINFIGDGHDFVIPAKELRKSIRLIYIPAQ